MDIHFALALFLKNLCKTLAIKAQETKQLKQSRSDRIKSGKEKIDYNEEKERQLQDEKEKLMDKRPPDAIKEAKKKVHWYFQKKKDVVLNQKDSEGVNGEVPKQRNIARLQFLIEEKESEENIRVVIEAPRYLDTSQIDVDIHPLWFQVVIKGDLLLLHLPKETSSKKNKKFLGASVSKCLVISQVKLSESRVRRVMSTGWLELILPKLHFNPTNQARLSTKRECPENGGTEKNLKTDHLQKEYASEQENERSKLCVLDNIDETDVPPLE
ncbi:hypothetical protein RFI_07828 [Reticulomyxa filosa]|uniref:Dynein axonemal assembly factor 11-like CS domain-containing protein n=1 Tax=Reticulomyxa filosa TaxID=46433 RepID=X6NVI2_RETFI|nr:hypothetical protein RFI_07828 [Reticulomyxa filosa]|eukprot:ETO29297.1 hypothetical protein RFI_07828 [Reticulomyxa filosa]